MHLCNFRLLQGRGIFLHLLVGIFRLISMQDQQYDVILSSYEQTKSVNNEYLLTHALCIGNINNKHLLFFGINMISTFV